jgi:DNA-binding HxlR family transcriptional regulator
MNLSTHAEFERSHCPVANALDLFGDKWTLLIVRDLILGKAKYGEFASSPEAIPTNILANRLKRLEAAGVIARTAYSLRPARHHYELTEKGRDLQPVLEAMVDWALKHVPGVQVFPRHEAAAIKIKP